MKCGEKEFEIVRLSGLPVQGDVHLVQCSHCGGVVGASIYWYVLQDIAQKLERIERQLASRS